MLAGQRLGIKEVDEGIWLVSFMHYDLGYFDLEQKTLQPLDNPFGPRLSPMSWVRSVTHVSGLDKYPIGGGRGTGIQHSPPWGQRSLGPQTAVEGARRANTAG